MRSQPRSVFGSVSWAYLACFVAGGATVGLASSAYQLSGGSHGRVRVLNGLSLAHRAVSARVGADVPAQDVVPAVDQKVPQAVLLARVGASEPRPEAPEEMAPSDADLDADLSSKADRKSVV